MGDAALPIKLTVRKQDGLDSDGKDLPFTLGASVADVRAAVAKHFEEAPEKVDLLLSGCVALDDASCLGDYGLVGGDKATAEVDVIIAPPEEADAEGEAGKDGKGKAKAKEKPADGKASGGAGSGAAASAAPVYEGPVRLTLSNILPGVHVELGESHRLTKLDAATVGSRCGAPSREAYECWNLARASSRPHCANCCPPIPPSLPACLSACLQTPTRGTPCGCWPTRSEMPCSAQAARPRSGLVRAPP